MQFRLKRHPKRVCWALTGRSFGFSTAPLVKAPLEGAQPAQILIMSDLVVFTAPGSTATKSFILPVRGVAGGVRGFPPNKCPEARPEGIRALRRVGRVAPRHCPDICVKVPFRERVGRPGGAPDVRGGLEP